MVHVVQYALKIFKIYCKSIIGPLVFFLQLPALVALGRFNSIMDSSLIFSPFVLLFANAVMIDEKKGEALNEDRRHQFF